MTDAKRIKAGRHRPHDAESFWSWVDRVEDGCWEWRGCVGSRGYGKIRWEGRSTGAHRVAAFLSGLIQHIEAIGRNAGNELVLHHCDNRSCCNPAHLFVGTAKANMQDAKAKGRHPFGDSCGKSKLTGAQVKEIRGLLDSGHTRRSIARLFGVTKHAIASIATQRTWSQ